MELSSKFLLFVGLIAGLIVHSIANGSDDNKIEEQFDVKPAGSLLEYELKWQGIKCTFTYAAGGGTNEKWLMSLERAEDKSYSCAVYRPGIHSYLFFMSFQLLVEGATLTDVYLESEPGKAMNPEEYIVGDPKDNFVKQNDSKFGSKLVRVQINAKKSRTEL